MKKQSGVKGRVLIPVSIVCGSLAASLFWKNSQDRGPYSLSEGQAKKIGFSGAKEYQSMSDASARMYAHTSVSGGGWDDDDFKFYSESLAGQNKITKRRVIYNLANLHKSSDRRRAIALLGTREIPEDEKHSWEQAIREWTVLPEDSWVLPWLISCQNKGLAAIAKEVQRGKTKSN